MPKRAPGCWFLAGATLLAHSALAHSPVFDCFNETADQVTCEGGFSDGASAAGVNVRVLDKNDRLLLEGKIDAEGRISFAKPAAEFHVVFDAGAGHTVTLFSTDITD